MTITLNHTIVWARDKESAARFFAEIFGLRFKGFVRVRALRLAQAEQQVADLTAALKEARQDRDRWQQSAERLASKTNR